MYETREQTPQNQISDASYPYLPSTFPNYYAPPPPPPHHHPHPHFFDSNPNYGVYPSNCTVIAAQPINYSDSNVDSSNWVVKESEPVKYTPVSFLCFSLINWGSFKFSYFFSSGEFFLCIIVAIYR